MTTKDGGPAFPCTNEQFTLGNPQTGDAWAGMTLRDWFAGQALPAIWAEEGADDDTMTLPEIAHEAYRMADAMLAERSKP